MKILILGGDGYLGWPTSLYFSNQNHDVLIIDNFIKRKLQKKFQRYSLFKNYTLKQKINEWKKVSKKNIEYKEIDATNYKSVLNIFKKFKPDAVIHFAEQPSAPLSMLDYNNANFTLQNNLVSTLNICYAIKETKLDTHIIKLGTMGEYGTPNIDIEEGYLKIKHKKRSDIFLYPRKGSSLYHTTKIQDTDLLYFYSRTWGLRVTDLMQGPVYGFDTNEINGNEKIYTSFSYDDIFGTVLNRFIVQAVAGETLTVYGNGSQKRGYLNITDSIKCIDIATKFPASKGELNIFNQYTETFSIIQLAKKVIEAGKKIGINAKFKNIKNPRVEKENHYYKPSNKKFIKLGLKPNFLTQKILCEMIIKVEKHKKSIKNKNFLPTVNWNE